MTNLQARGFESLHLHNITLKLKHMLGIEKLKDTCVTLINIGEGLDSRLEDGKLSIMEIATLLPKLWGIKNIITDAAEIWAEMVDLDPLEQRELGELIAEELDLNNDNLEEIVNKCVEILYSIKDLVVEIGELIELFKDAKAN